MILDRFVSTGFLAIIAFGISIYVYICLAKAAIYETMGYFTRTK